MVGDHPRFSIWVLAWSGASALVKRSRSLLPYARVALIWSVGAWMATRGLVAIAYVMPLQSSPSEFVWYDSDNTVNHACSFWEGAWYCCADYDTSMGACNTIWGDILLIKASCKISSASAALRA